MEAKWKELPHKKKDDQSAAEKKSKRDSRRKSRKSSSNAVKNIDVRYNKTGNKKSEAQAQCSLTLGQGESAWNPTKNAAESLFPNVQAVVNEQMTEDEMMSQALMESLAIAQEKSMIDAIPDVEAGEKVAVNSDDEDTWGKVQQNLPSSEPEKESKVSDANNNSGLHSQLGPIENLTVPAVKLQTRHSEILLGNKATVGDEPLVPIIKPKFIDKYGRVDGYTEKRMFMGKGARFREEEYLKQQQQQQQQQKQQQQEQQQQPQHQQQEQQQQQQQEQQQQPQQQQQEQQQQPQQQQQEQQQQPQQLSTANSHEDLRESAESSSRQAEETIKMSATKDFLENAAQPLETVNATVEAISQDPAIITMQFNRKSEEIPDSSQCSVKPSMPIESEEGSSVHAQPFDNPTKQLTSGSEELPSVTQESIPPLMKKTILKVDVQEFFPSNYVFPASSSVIAELPGSSVAQFTKQPANCPEGTREFSHQDFNSQTRHRDSGPTSIMSGTQSNNHQEARYSTSGHPANRRNYQEDDRSSNKSSREYYGGHDRGSRSEQNAGKSHGRSNRSSYSGSRDDRNFNKPYENSYCDDHQVARHEQNPHKYRGPNRGGFRGPKQDTNPYKYENPNRENYNNARHEQNPQKYGEQNCGNQRGPRVDRNGEVQRPPGEQRRDVQKPPGEHRPDVLKPPGEHRPDVQRPTGEQRSDVHRPPGEQRPDVQKEPTDRQNGHVQVRQTESNRDVPARPAAGAQNHGMPWVPKTEENPCQPSEESREKPSVNYAKALLQNVSISAVPIQRWNVPAAASFEKPPTQQPEVAKSGKQFEDSVAPSEAKVSQDALNISDTEPPPLSMFNSRHTTTHAQESAPEIPPAAPSVSPPMEMMPRVPAGLMPSSNPLPFGQIVQPSVLPPMTTMPHVPTGPMPPSNPSTLGQHIPASVSPPMEMTMPPTRPELMPQLNPSTHGQPPRYNETNDVARVEEAPPMTFGQFSMSPPGFHHPAQPATELCATCANSASRPIYKPVVASLESRYAALRRIDPMLYKLLLQQLPELGLRLSSGQPEFSRNANEPPEEPRPHAGCSSCGCKSQFPNEPSEPSENVNQQRSEDPGSQAEWCRTQGAPQFAEHSVPANTYFPSPPSGLYYLEPAQVAQRHERSECVAGNPPYPGNLLHETPPFAGRMVEPVASAYYPASRVYEAAPQPANMLPHPAERFRYGQMNLSDFPPEFLLQMQRQWMMQLAMASSMAEHDGTPFPPQMANYLEHGQPPCAPFPPQMANYLEHGQPRPAPFPPKHQGHDLDTMRRCDVGLGHPEVTHDANRRPPAVSSGHWPENPPPVPQSEAQPTVRPPQPPVPVPIVGRGRGQLRSMQRKN